MLRIGRVDLAPPNVNLILQGRIVAAWADLLERECRQLIASGCHVALDLSEVFYIGRSGCEALSRLGKAGARIFGCSPLIAATLEQAGIVGGAELKVGGA